MHVVVLYREKTGKKLIENVKKMFHVEKEEIKGMGNVYVYETKHKRIYFYSPKLSYETNPEFVEKVIKESIGSPDVVVSVNPHIADTREGVFIHTAGNVYHRDLIGAGLQPCTLSPTNPSYFGLILRASTRFYEEFYNKNPMHLEATHDLPTNNGIPYISFEVNGDYFEFAALVLVAGAGKKEKFTPYLGIGKTYYGDEFIPLVKKKKVVPYYIPAYLSHALTEEIIRRAKKKGLIKDVLLGKGVTAKEVFL